MAATVPFEVVTASVSGLGLNFQVTTTSQTTTIVNKNAPTLSIAYALPNANAVSQGMAYIRLSTESAPVATINDIGLAPNTVKLFANPVPFGTLGVAVICSVSTTLGPGIINITPGEGGI